MKAPSKSKIVSTLKGLSAALSHPATSLDTLQTLQAAATVLTLIDDKKCVEAVHNLMTRVQERHSLHQDNRAELVEGINLLNTCAKAAQKAL